MGRDFTLFQFDVDEDTLRSVLSSVPGVTPLPPDERAGTEDDAASPHGDRRRSTTAADEERPTDSDSERSDGPAAGSPGVEAHLDDSISTGSERAAARKWTGPSTPWPGAPADEEEGGGWRDRLTDKRTLLVGGAVALVGVVGAVAVWFLKFRGDGGSDAGSAQKSESRARPVETTHADSEPDSAEREPPADDSESRSYPVDPAPVVGITFLAVATIVLRYVQSRSET